MKARNDRSRDTAKAYLRSRIERGSALLVAACLFTGFAGTAHGENEFRIWTSSRGDSIEAMLVADDGETVRLEDRNGQAMAIKRANLSEADRVYLDGAGDGEPGRQTNGVVVAATEESASSNQAAWLAQDAVISTRIKDVDITESYSEPVDTLILTKKPLAGFVLVVVEFRLKALVAESNAVDRLVKVRAAQAEELPHIGTVLAIDSAERNALRGHYRYFDLSNDVALVNTNDARYAPSWMLLPDAQRGIYLLETGGPEKVFGGTRAAKPWRQTCQTNKGFTGLLDVGVPVNVGLLFTVPKAAKLDVLKLQVGEVEPVALTAK